MRKKFFAVPLVFLGLTGAALAQESQGTPAPKSVPSQASPAKPAGQQAATQRRGRSKLPHRKPRVYRDRPRNQEPQQHEDRQGMPPHDSAPGIHMEPDGM